MVYVEPAFPRGSNTEANVDKTVPKKKYTKHIKYGASTKDDVKPRHLRPEERRRALLEEKEKEVERQDLAYKANNLSIHTIQKGMLVLGCVRRILNTQLEIALPGRLYGIVPISAISNAYSKRLQEMMRSNSIDCPTLKDLYTIGDLVYVKVVSKMQSSNIMLSLNPADLHSEFVSSQLVPGLVLAASIAVEEDHGYSMETGIHHVRAFLPHESLRKNPADIGRNLFCSVEKVNQLGGKGPTLILKAFRKKDRYMLNVGIVNLDMIVPGCIVPFTVGTPLQNGLRGTLFDDTVSAYVNQNMLTHPTSTLDGYSLFKQLDATLLYVLPVTKQVFVSLVKYPNNRVEPGTTLLPGSNIKNAQVVNAGNTGVWFHFDDRRALLPKNVIKKSLGNEGNYDDATIFGKYHIGSIHTLSVVRYDILDRSYVVCDNVYNAASEIESPMDVQIGETYKCQIYKMNHAGVLFVKLGQVSGKVLDYFCERNTSVKEGSIVPMKAVFHEAQGLYVQFTNRREFLRKTAKILHDWKQLDYDQKSQTFDGLVVNEDTNYFVVAFFNNIRGILYKKVYGVLQNSATINRLRCGTVERFTIHRFDIKSQKLLLSIPIGPEVRSIEIGQATVTGVYPTGVDVLVGQNDEQGTIPLKYFSAFSEHNSLFVKLLKEGHQVKVVKVRALTYSARDVRYFEQNPILTKHVRRGDILRASCSVDNGKLYANLLLSDYADPVVPFVNKGVGDVDHKDIPEGKIIMMKVTSKQEIKGGERYLLHVSSSLKDVCPMGLKNVFSYMIDYLEDVLCLIERYRQCGMSFANYNIGQKVVCTIETLFEDGDNMIVKVHDDSNSGNTIKGMAKKATTTAMGPKISCNVGDQLDGRVVWVDVERQLLHVCVDPMLLQCFEEDLTGGSSTLLKTGKIRRCWVLFRNDYIRVCCMKKGTRNPLVVVPVRHHYNDLRSLDDDKASIGVLLLEHLGPLIFGMEKKYYDIYSSFDMSQVSNVNQAPEAIFLAEKSEHDRVANDESLPENESYRDTLDVCEEESDPEVTKNVETIESKKKFAIGNGTGVRKQTQMKNAQIIQTKKPTKRKNVTSEKSNQMAENNLKKILEDRKSEKKERVNGSLGNNLPAMHNGENPNEKLKKRLEKRNDILQAENFVERKEKMKAKKKKITTIRDELVGEHKGEKSNKTIKTAKRHHAASIVEEHVHLKKKMKKQAPFVIEQLDGGGDDVFLSQLDGAEMEVQSRKATKRTHDAKESKGLPGATNFWDSTSVYKRLESDSSEEEDSEVDERDRASTKKLITAKERFEAMKHEEERLRKIEEELADPSVDPHTPDQFDRLVLAQPNNSLLWIRYMVFHMESAELDKARAVGRKALKAINFREEADLLNVWIALLNLEIRYETVDTFKEVLQEAIQYNDAFKVYSRVLDILIDCQKLSEVRDLLELLQKKFRKQNDMWYLVADAWYRIGQGSKVKPLLSQGLKSLPNREHISLIVKFAFLHNRNENRDEAHLLFEQILTSYPKRTDIWSQYVDMLVKDGLIGNARQIMERAVVQRLPMKNMKTLYTKFVNFEEKHGDRDSVRRVKQMATDYVQTQLNNAGVATVASKAQKRK